MKTRQGSPDIDKLQQDVYPISTMLQRILLTIAVFAISIVGGAASVAFMLDRHEEIGAVAVNGWTTFPDIGTPEAAPYSKARMARDGLLSLGRAEGLTFVARRDSENRQLLRECSYTITGSTPPSRFWTLFAADKSLLALNSGKNRHPATHSRNILRQPDNSFVITFAPHPAPGNWVLLNGKGEMAFLLKLYDTPPETGSDLTGIELPRIVRGSCNG